MRPGGPPVSWYVSRHTVGNRPKPPVHIPLSLPTEGCWEIEEGRVDPVGFLSSLPTHFPEASTLFVEGTSIDVDVVDSLNQFAEAGKYLPESQTYWPKTRQFRCAFGEELCAKLAQLATAHADPELFDHLFLYSGEKVLLEWPDAFTNCLWISSSLAEERVAMLARSLGLSYRHASVG